MSAAAAAGPPLQLPSQQAKEGFEEGVGLLFSAWTALVLAVENEWGGPDSSDKANFLIDDIIQWFYRKKEHHVDELEMELLDSLLQDFNLEVEDGSANQIARALVELHQACCRNDAGPLLQLRAQQAAGVSGAAASKRGATTDLDGADVSSSGSSDDDDDDDDGSMDEDAAPPSAVGLVGAAAAGPPPGPVVDADGFEMVQKRRGR